MQNLTKKKKVNKLLLFLLHKAPPTLVFFSYLSFPLKCQCTRTKEKKKKRAPNFTRGLCRKRWCYFAVHNHYYYYSFFFFVRAYPTKHHRPQHIEEKALVGKYPCLFASLFVFPATLVKLISKRTPHCL